ncbi:putative ribosome maturation factor RimP [Mycobacterium lepromatosis]|nr:hypothetical protein [Mycobacterium lepromatosis]UKN42381.1 putative ribosome maturation factor RimP [Mycobacterium lepromatosis]
MNTELPSQLQVIELLGGEFARASYEVGYVIIHPRSQLLWITVRADSDTVLGRDTIAILSRSASALLDSLDNIAERYVLELSSPDMAQPLASEKHFRRDRGLEVELAVVGRIPADRSNWGDVRRHGDVGDPRRPPP